MVILALPPHFVPRCSLTVAIGQPLHQNEQDGLPLPQEAFNQITDEGNDGSPTEGFYWHQAPSGTVPTNIRRGRDYPIMRAERVERVQRTLLQEVCSKRLVIYLAPQTLSNTSVGLVGLNYHRPIN